MDILRTIRATAALSLALLTILLTSTTALAEVRVVTTVGDLGAMAREVVGDHGEVVVLASPQDDPHFVDARPSYVAELAKADVLVFNGLGLEEGWLPTLVLGSRNPKVQPGQSGHVDASTFVQKRAAPKGKVTRAAGDVHPGGNPHWSFEPRQMGRAALGLGKRLGEIDPANRDAYAANARAFAKKAIGLDRSWTRKFASLPKQKRRVVVYHDAWSYLLEWLDLEQVAAIEPKPGVSPNPRHIASVLKTMREEDVKVVLQMEYYPGTTSSLLAEKAGARVVIAPGQARPEQSYVKRIDRLASAIYEGLSGESQPSTKP